MSTLMSRRLWTLAPRIWIAAGAVTEGGVARRVSSDILVLRKNGNRQSGRRTPAKGTLFIIRWGRRSCRLRAARPSPRQRGQAPGRRQDRPPHERVFRPAGGLANAEPPELRYQQWYCAKTRPAKTRQECSRLLKSAASRSCFSPGFAPHAATFPGAAARIPIVS